MGYFSKFVGVCAAVTLLSVTVVGAEEKNNAILELLTPFGIREIVRTGRIAIARSSVDTGERKPARAGRSADGAE